MLASTRQVEQEVRIGRDVTIRVLGIRGGHVRLGIDAPRNVQVLRDDAIRTDGGDDDGDE